MKNEAMKRGCAVNLKVNRKLMVQSQWQQIGSMQFGPRGDRFKKIAQQHPSAMTATSQASRWSQI
ncbi:hypothetical protein [Paraburkholderia sediminicola]|uniref:hypothetical protein n=1 Tax=Paraburkholderia sediminicola TaxID=458836 RepID=UPI0038BAD0CC